MTMTTSTKFLVYVTIVLLVFIWGHAGQSLYNQYMPLDHWVEYHDVAPMNTKINAGHTLYMVSDTTIHKPVNLKFNDVLHCIDPLTQTWQRFSEQNTTRALSLPEEDRKTTWPYSPIPTYDTKCYVESNVVLVFSSGQQRMMRFDGLEHGHIIDIIAGGSSNTIDDRSTDSYSGNGGSAPE